MEKQEKYDMERLVDLAASGNRDALEELLGDVQDMVFNLSLRMLGTVPDAEDACQEILIKVMTHLSDFRKESRFSTWVFRVAVNHVLAYRKHMFSQHPLSFEYYGEDIANGREEDVPDMTGGVDRGILEEELKLYLHQCNASVSGRGKQMYFYSGNHVPSGQRSSGRDSGNITGCLQKEIIADKGEDGGIFGGILRSGRGKCSCRRRVDYAYCQPPADTGAPGVQRHGTGTEQDCRTVQGHYGGD